MDYVSLEGEILIALYCRVCDCKGASTRSNNARRTNIVTISQEKQCDVLGVETMEVDLVPLFVARSTSIVSALMTSSCFSSDMVTILSVEHCSIVCTHLYGLIREPKQNLSRQNLSWTNLFMKLGVCEPRFHYKYNHFICRYHVHCNKLNKLLLYYSISLGY